ncbi:NADH-quinone oxidoreductase subunit J family protein [Syntrophomonas erecta]
MSLTLSDVVFIVTALFTIGAATGVVTFNNIVHSALSLILTFLGVAAIYFQLQAGFLGLVQIMVYAGAISVLVIFAIMLVMDKDPSETNRAYPWGRFVAGLTALAVIATLGYTIITSQFQISSQVLPDDMMGQIAGLLMGDYVIAFELAAVLLLVAVVGAIILAKGADDQ